METLKTKTKPITPALRGQTFSAGVIGFCGVFSLSQLEVAVSTGNWIFREAARAGSRASPVIPR